MNCLINLAIGCCHERHDEEDILLKVLKRQL
jgi:hypothetical protein